MAILYGCTVRYHTSLPGHVYLHEKLQENVVGSTKRKVSILAASSEQAEEKNTLSTPLWTITFKGQRLYRPQ